MCSPNRCPRACENRSPVGHRRALDRREVAVAGYLRGLRRRDAGVLEEMSGLFRTPYYHVWTSTDLSASRCARRPELLRSRSPVLWRPTRTVRVIGARYRNYDYGAALFGQAARELGVHGTVGGHPERHRVQGVWTCSSPAWEDVRESGAARRRGSGGVSEARERMPG